MSMPAHLDFCAGGIRRGRSQARDLGTRARAQPNAGDQKGNQERSLQVRTTVFALLEVVDASLRTPTGGGEIHFIRRRDKKNEATPKGWPRCETRRSAWCQRAAARSASIAWSASIIFWADSSMSITRLSMRDTK